MIFYFHPSVLVVALGQDSWLAVRHTALLLLNWTNLSYCWLVALKVRDQLFEAEESVWILQQPVI